MLQLFLNLGSCKQYRSLTADSVTAIHAPRKSPAVLHIILELFLRLGNRQQGRYLKDCVTVIHAPRQSLVVPFTHIRIVLHLLILLGKRQKCRSFTVSVNVIHATWQTPSWLLLYRQCHSYFDSVSSTTTIMQKQPKLPLKLCLLSKMSIYVSITYQILAVLTGFA